VLCSSASTISILLPALLILIPYKSQSKRLLILISHVYFTVIFTPTYMSHTHDKPRRVNSMDLAIRTSNDAFPIAKTIKK
jgi:hypothetical protein